jgi:hypothetical protein
MVTEGDESKKTEDSIKYICDFDMECHVEWASVVYSQAVRYARPETIDKATKGKATDVTANKLIIIYGSIHWPGIMLAQLILRYALEELEDDDIEWVSLVKGTSIQRIIIIIIMIRNNNNNMLAYSSIPKINKTIHYVIIITTTVIVIIAYIDICIFIPYIIHSYYFRCH